MKLIVGLGNPGEKYAKTRHNVGFMVADELARKLLPVERTSWQFDKYANSLVLKINSDLLLAKPQTMMNASGQAVRVLAKRYQLEAKSLFVVHDDLDLPLGKIKIRTGGGSAGHRGVDSIIKELEDDGFVRFRLGVGRPHPEANKDKVEKFVLSTFKFWEKKEASRMVKKAVEAVKLALDQGLDKAANRYN